MEGFVKLSKPAYILGIGSAGGKSEKDGPYGSYFDIDVPDALYNGEKSFELAEKKMYLETAKRAIEDAGLTQSDIGVMLGGDLLNQIITASYSARDLNIPFLGLYGACSSMTESLAVGSMFISGGFFKNVLCATSSHFATAERQYRFPLEQGAPKPPTGQDTVTAAGATVITSEKTNIKIEYLTVGRVVDFGITDNNNMGAAMAPAAVESLLTHLENRNAQPSDYDAIVTGDLGVFGSEMLCDLAYRLGTDLSPVHKDCGAMIYQGLKGHRSGASGCGCSAVMLNAYFLRKMRRGECKRILFAATGALMSPTSIMQGESICGVAHVVEIEAEGGTK